MKALEGIRILDLSHMLSGPYCTQLLADMGAETIKIEPPHKGEGTRRLLEKDPKHSREGMGAYFMTLGRNKKSVAIDLKSPAGLKVFHELVKVSDVVVFNFRAGVASKLGIDYSKLMEINPKIVTCSITGFGETGPNAHAVSFDLVAQAAGGGMSITGDGTKPLRSGIPTGDLGGGLMGTIGILGALQAIPKLGHGQHVDISMQDAQVSMLNYMATMYFLSGEQPPAIGNSHFVHVPYDTFATENGHIILAIITDALWARLMELIDLPDLNTKENEGQPGRWKNRDHINAEVSKKLKTKSREHWLEQLQGKGVPCAPVNNFEDTFKDEHIQARNMVVDVPLPNGETIKQVGNPIKMSETYEDSYTAPPTLGRDTEEILKSLIGITEDELAQLRAEGAVQ